MERGEVNITVEKLYRMQACLHAIHAAY
nr:hypothetical protein [Pseudomonas antarctica]